MSQKPDHCKGCALWHKAGHPKGSVLRGSKYDNWCCNYGKEAPKAVGMCKLLGGKADKQPAKMKTTNAEITGAKRPR